MRIPGRDKNAVGHQRHAILSDRGITTRNRTQLAREYVHKRDRQMLSDKNRDANPLRSRRVFRGTRQYPRRVSRSAAGRALDSEALTLAVVASIRHQDTGYDDLLMSGVPRDEARDQIRPAIDRILASWA